MRARVLSREYALSRLIASCFSISIVFMHVYKHLSRDAVPHAFARYKRDHLPHRARSRIFYSSDNLSQQFERAPGSCITDDSRAEAPHPRVDAARQSA